MKDLLTLIVLIAIVGGGYYYYEHNKGAVDNAVATADNAKNAIVATTTAGIDAATKTGLGSIAPVSLAYYAENRNYGISATKNICNDTTSPTSVGSVVSAIQQYTKAIDCTVDTDFPSKSFTITAPSLANSGEYYCIDQNGTVDLIANINTSDTFKAGLSCM